MHNAPYKFQKIESASYTSSARDITRRNFNKASWILEIKSNMLTLVLINRAFIDFLIGNTGAPMESFHLMGHSAGAHVAGAAGRKC